MEDHGGSINCTFVGGVCFLMLFVTHCFALVRLVGPVLLQSLTLI